MKYNIKKTLMWICDCEPPLIDLIPFKERTCDICKAERPKEVLENIKKQIRLKISSKGGIARANSLSAKRRKEISIKANKAKNK